MSCGPSPNVTNGYVQPGSNDYGSIRRIFCIDLHELPPNALPQIKCEDNGNWTTVPSCESVNKNLNDSCGNCPWVNPALSYEMMEAAQNGNLTKVQILLHRCADVNSMWPQDLRSALMTAANYSRAEVVRKLLNCNATVDSQNSDGTTALMFASGNGSLETVGLLLNAGAQVNISNHQGFTALIIAAKTGQTKTARGLLRFGANINAVDNQGNSALIWAVRGGHLATINLLLKRNIPVNAANSAGATALHEAAEMGHSNVVTSLIAAGASKNLLDNNGKSPQEIAAESGHWHIVGLLGKGVARRDQSQCLQCNGETLLNNSAAVLEVVKTNNLESLEFLLNKCLNPNSIDSATNTSALMFAASGGNLEIVRALLRCQALVDLQSSNGSTALMFAAKTGNLTIVDELLNAGANAMIRDDAGKMARFYAVQRRYTSVAALLRQQMSIG